MEAIATATVAVDLDLDLDLDDDDDQGSPAPDGGTAIQRDSDKIKISRKKKILSYLDVQWNVEQNHHEAIDEASSATTEALSFVRGTISMHKSRLKDTAVNPKLDIKHWSSKQFEAQLAKLEKQQALVETIDNRYVKLSLLRKLRKKAERLRRKSLAAYDTYTDEAKSGKYTTKSYDFVLIADTSAAELNGRFDNIGVSFEEVKFTIDVALRTDEDSSHVDMLQEWEGLDRFIASGKMDVAAYHAEIRDTIDRLESDLAKTDGADDRQALAEVAINAINSARNRACAEFREIVYNVVGTAYLLKKRLKVYKQIRAKTYGLAAINATTSIVRLVVSMGTDGTAYLTLGRSLISAFSFWIREACTSVLMAWYEVKKALKAIQDAAVHGVKALKGIDLATFTANKLAQVIGGTSVPLVKKNLRAYQDDLLLFAAKLQKLRQGVTEKSVELQTWLKEVNGVIARHEEGITQLRADPSADPDEISRREDVLLDLQYEQGNIGVIWKKITKDIRRIDAGFTATFLEAEGTINGFQKLVNSKVLINPNKGVKSADAVRAVFVGLNVYSTASIVAPEISLQAVIDAI